MTTIHVNPEIPAMRPHFVILDGLRGIAALAIVVFHFMEWVIPDFNNNFIAHGFLAVDFFFCLSGFVIAYAYDHRIRTMGMWSFFKARLIRLHPLVILGSVLGLLFFFIDPFDAAWKEYDASRLLMIFLCSLLLIPFPVMEDRAFNLFGLNAPAWSLFWEYVANIVYAFLLCRLNRRVLLLLAVPAAAGICWVSYDTGNLLGGWSKDNFWDGGIRVAYSFLAGMLIYRFNWVIQNRVGFIGLVFMLSVVFVMPYNSWNWLTESFVVLVYFPFLVALGAGSSLSPRLTRFAVLSGQISYPLYMTHYGPIWIFGHYYTSQKPGSGELVIVILTGVVLMIGFAYLAMKAYDLPLRRWLSSRLRRN